MSTEPYIPPATNLSKAWAHTIIALLAPGVKELTPIVISVDKFHENGMPIEDRRIKTRLDKELESHPIGGKSRGVIEVASTIFPMSMWNPSVENSDAQLYERYLTAWPRIQKRDRLNAKGQYFQRLIAYGMLADQPKSINQLDHIIKSSDLSGRF